MLRNPRPFFRQLDGWWYVQLRRDGRRKQIKLAQGKDNEQAAWQRYHEIMAQPDMTQCADPTRLTVPQICDAYLDWAQKNLSQASYHQQKHMLQKFCNHWGKLLVSQFKPFHVTRWLEANSKWRPHTIRDAVGIVKRAFNWASNEVLTAVENGGAGRPNLVALD